ncbi:MAG: ribonuclease HI [Phycisphaeraceae bacterium]|nr:ribonuclease HI [Phycisphaeraceae bacterium]
MKTVNPAKGAIIHPTAMGGVRKLASMLARFELYTDGACSGNPGPGGWAFILRGEGIDGEVARSGFDPQTTNNRMELLAIIEGLEALPADRGKVSVTSDSEYAVKGLREWLDGWKQKGWKTSRREPVKNDDLWKRLDALRERHEVSMHWVRGHKDHPENNRCDQMAVAEIERRASRR